MADVLYTVYCPSGTGGGGTNPGGGGGGTPNEPPPVEPDCIKKALIENRATNTTVASQMASIRTNSTINEYGAEQNLTSLNGNPEFKNIPVRTDGNPSNFNFNFTWNPIAGYTIGFNHGHPLGSAPSPDDVFLPAKALVNVDLINGGSGEMNFFKSNVTVMVTTASGTWVVTIKDWTKYLAAYASFTANESQYNQDWLTAGVGKDKGYALLDKLGDAVDLRYAEVGKSNYRLMKITNDKAHVIASDPCNGLIGPPEMID